MILYFKIRKKREKFWIPVARKCFGNIWHSLVKIFLRNLLIFSIIPKGFGTLMKETSSKHSFSTNFINYSIFFQFLNIPPIIYQISSDYLQSFKVPHNIQKWEISSETLRNFQVHSRNFPNECELVFLRKQILSNLKKFYRLKFRKSVDHKCFGKISHFLQNMYKFWENFR